MINYESIGKEAVAAGYDGGGIWSDSLCSFWEMPHEPVISGYWPDFSHPETEGAALAWIAAKRKSEDAVLELYILSYRVGLVGIKEGRPYHSGDAGELKPTKVEALLSAIKSLGLGKKDNSPMGLNKRLLEVGFRDGGCYWFNEYNNQMLMECFAGIDNAVKNKRLLYPDGSHPSTIGVATAWLRSFPKIGDTFHIMYSDDLKKWIPYLFGTVVRAIKTGVNSELEALVEFAEWAQKEGLMA